MTYICLISENTCRLILRRHIYTSYISFICCLILNAHINLTYHETICRLLPTTSHNTVQGFHPSHVYRRSTFPTLNQFTCHYVYAHFQWPYYSETFTCVTHSKSETLKGPGVPCHNIPYQVDDGPLCRHTMSARRVISSCDNFAHFKFIIFMCIFFSITLISDGFLSWVTRLQLFMESFHVAVCARLWWGLVTWREAVEAFSSGLWRAGVCVCRLRGIVIPVIWQSKYRDSSGSPDVLHHWTVEICEKGW